MASVMTQWQITGDYFENCNCDVLCPCEVSGKPMLTSQPTYGVCDVPLAFHIEQGHYGSTPLDGLNAVVMAHSPGPMANGNWSVALYLEERANDAQREALQTIFSGQAGGVMGGFAPLISTVVGIRSVAITFTKDGMHRSLAIPNIAYLAVTALPSPVPGKEMTISGMHPINLDSLVLAMGDEGSVYQDFGMNWNNAGRNGHYAPINWSNAS
ncbi:MAG TPA: DUF1326 domain-containing protein [Ktedonobacterales bacterium]